MPYDPAEEHDRAPLMNVRSRRRSAFPPVVLMGVFIVLALALGGTWAWFHFRTGTDALPTLSSDSLAPAPTEPFVLPPLEGSDSAVRRLASTVASHPQLASWLATDDLIRRFVQAVVDISRGSSPVPELEVLIPERPFSVDASGERVLMGPASFRRYDVLTRVFTSISTPDAVQVYERLLPLFRQAYRELGVSDGTWEEVLARAVGNLLSVEVPDGPLEVREAVGRYVYVNREIESLPPARKHLLRMGPQNARQVQGKLREISEALGLTTESSEGP